MPPERRRVLFVDDEPELLNGLRVTLRRERARWDMRFAASGRDALRELSEAPADVVMTDMRMPEMDGATLLMHVRTVQPQCLRIVLSGQADEIATLRALPYAHQWLSKPCTRDEVVNVIDRACHMRDLITSPEVQAVVGGISALPALPAAYRSLLELLSDPGVVLDRVAGAIEDDPALSAKVLQLANSAFFGVRRQLSSVRDATSVLGLSTLSRLVLATEVFSGLGAEPDALDLQDFQKHALLTARLAGRIAGDVRRAEVASTAGLLHDVGLLVMAAHLPRAYRELCREKGVGDPAVERMVVGTTHARIGAALLGAWGLPNEVLEAVAFHHDPARLQATGVGTATGASTLDTALVVHVASALASEARDFDSPHRQSVDTALLEARGVAGSLPEWRRWLEEELARGSGGGAERAA